MAESDKPEKRRGRPKAEEPMTSVSAWVRTAELDRLIKIANQREMTVSSLVRYLLVTKLK